MRKLGFGEGLMRYLEISIDHWGMIQQDSVKIILIHSFLLSRFYTNKDQVLIYSKFTI